MASKTFLLLALAVALVLLITSEVVAAEDLASNHDGEVDGRGGYNRGGRGGYGGYNKDGGRGGSISRGHEGHGKGGGSGKYGGGGRHCRKVHGCSSVAEATAYKQTQN
ncbi:putative glycine rich protein [Helianthus debilis subsp. tardiflorus]